MKFSISHLASALSTIKMYGYQKLATKTCQQNNSK